LKGSVWIKIQHHLQFPLQLSPNFSSSDVALAQKFNWGSYSISLPPALKSGFMCNVLSLQAIKTSGQKQ